MITKHIVKVFNMKMTFFNGLDKENILVHLISMIINLIMHIDNVHRNDPFSWNFAPI